MDLTALRIFLSVAEERSFSRAAAKVHRTQPAVSQAVKRLEDELGEQLFDRSSKSGTLTDAGRVLQNYGQRLVPASAAAAAAAPCALARARPRFTRCCRSWRGSVRKFQISPWTCVASPPVRSPSKFSR